MLADAGLIQTSLIWVTYAGAVALCLIAAAVTTLTWQTPRERSAVVSAVAVISLTALLATVLLLPVDIALVSATGSARLGVKKPWATPGRVADLLLALKVLYYTLYSLDALLCLLFIPFAYFWYEEYDEIEFEEEGRTWRSRLWAAAKYTLFFVALVVALFLVGFFVPAAGRGDLDGPQSWSWSWSGSHSDYLQLIAQSNGEKALTFALGLLVTLGTLLYVVYTGAGLALMPISFIQSAPGVSAPRLSAATASQLEQNRERRRQLEMRYAGRSDGDGNGATAMTRKDRRELDALIREEQTLVRRERLAAEAQGEGRSGLHRAWLRVCAFFRPVKMAGGIALLILSVLIAVSMLITGIDKATHSACKRRCGYLVDHIRVFQPINWIFVQAARAFPVDYVLMALLVLHLFSSSVSGIAAVGIRFLWIRVFQVRRGRTAPQALLIATVMLGLVTLAVNYAVAMFVAPQYAAFGTQTFCSLDPPAAGRNPDCRNRPDAVLPCGARAREFPFAARACTPSVASTFLSRITVTWPFFGIVAFWGQFALLAVFAVVLVTAAFRPPRVNLAELDEDAEEDEEESLLAATGRRFAASWEDARTSGGSRGSNSNNNNSRSYGTANA
ncbi:LMBR1-like membrane protein [Cordyceps fumosorosea ARSEF 2679]|uniref:Probable lysosomal cobalamin transporter n=1 Tax=Cordyceps fumosorosea (strain ARSEF 2679) TaxID=1081104 RepID=A0A167V6N9_CORFA|nr:LMBR1-like membrane protein [Cordyceps fumosorosea ARSEF 2679]OAA62285.1 LMBR1-like membrane protein [Cordyceps fumosorosea ARSEF 2679]